MTPATINRIWARLLLHSLQRAGVEDICIAPGSRSTPLTLEAELLRTTFPAIRLHTHFDERGLGFLALGLAKASGKPVAVIVTSGTAVANLLPAVAESRLTREKLVLLTADRPPELIQCGANQAISQQGIFGEHVEVATNLPSPTEQISPGWLLSTISEGLHRQSQEGGSYHINCPFPEPLYGDVDGADEYLSPISDWLLGTGPYLRFTAAIPDFSPVLSDWPHLQHQKGVLVVGKVTQADRFAISRLAEKLGWPLLCDPQACEGSGYAGFDIWLQNAACKAVLAQAELVVQFGSRLVSKRLGQFIQSFEGQYWLVENHPGRLDPSNRKGTRFVAAPESVAAKMSDQTQAPANKNWASMLLSASECYLQSLIGQKESDAGRLSELALAIDFANWLDGMSDLFIGNSMAVRLLDMCCKLPPCAVYTNRGASGIDGLIATACGVQRSRKRSMVMLVGDTSALYDLNSLALLTRNPYPLALVVINNNGGGIFDMLPVPDAKKEAFYRMPHGVEFRHAAAMFGLSYVCPDTLDSAREACLQAQRGEGTTLIELKVPAGQCGQDLKSLFVEIADAKLF